MMRIPSHSLLLYVVLAYMDFVGRRCQVLQYRSRRADEEDACILAARRGRVDVDLLWLGEACRGGSVAGVVAGRGLVIAGVQSEVLHTSSHGRC